MKAERETLVGLIRHGPTEWNDAGRIQGQTDVPLSAAGRRVVATWKLPRRLLPAQWISSPLKRALETAALMGCGDPIIEPKLMEMNWGEWEGMTLAQLRSEFGAAMGTNEARGLDFNPVGGESPRQVRRRVATWLSSVADGQQSRIAVTHKGVIRAAISLATQWDMTHSPPFPLRRDCVQIFRVNAQGTVAIYATNVSLTPGNGATHGQQNDFQLGF